MKKIKELCLNGACNRGICYIGCIKKFEDLKLLELEKITGVSIGSFIAVCYIIGYNSEELLDIIMNKDMENFKDFALDEKGAILKGENYKNWVHEVLSAKIDPYMTLEDLFKKTNIHFICTATCIYSTNEKYKEGIIIMSHELTPDIPVITAINASMAFPFIFPPVNYEGAKFIDGGVLDNVPDTTDIEIGKDAIKMKINFEPIDGCTSIENPISYVGKIFELISKRYTQLKNNEHLNDNLITIVCEDFKAIDFEMSLDDRITLYKRGYDAAEKFIKLKEQVQEQEQINN